MVLFFNLCRRRWLIQFALALAVAAEFQAGAEAVLWSDIRQFGVEGRKPAVFDGYLFGTVGVASGHGPVAGGTNLFIFPATIFWGMMAKAAPTVRIRTILALCARPVFLLKPSSYF